MTNKKRNKNKKRKKLVITIFGIFTIGILIILIIYLTTRKSVPAPQPGPGPQPVPGPQPGPAPQPPQPGPGPIPKSWKSGPNSCWRDARTDYNKLPKTHRALGYWGACNKTECSTGASRAPAQNFKDIDDIYDVVILAFLRFSSTQCNPPYSCSTTNPTCGGDPSTANNGYIYLALKRDLTSSNINDELIIPIKDRQKDNKHFVLASLGGELWSKSGPSGVPNNQWVDKMFASWKIVAKQFNLDGIDIDIETPRNNTAYIQLLKKIGDGGWLISCAPILANELIGYNIPNRNVCSVAQSPSADYLPTEDRRRTYNWFLTKQFINYLDIVNLQIYNSYTTVDTFQSNLEQFLLVFAEWCQTQNIMTNCISPVPSLYDPTKYSSCNPSTVNKLVLSPVDIRNKFYMGFCGMDCADSLHDISIPQIKKFLSYFRGIMIWAIDEDYQTPVTTTEWLKPIIQSTVEKGQFYK